MGKDEPLRFICLKRQDDLGCLQGLNRTFNNERETDYLRQREGRNAHDDHRADESGERCELEQEAQVREGSDARFSRLKGPALNYKRSINPCQSSELT